MSATNDSAGFFTGGAPAVKFEKVGDTVTGVIVDLEKRQQTDYKTKELLTWPDGKPRWQLAVTLQTNCNDADDNGLRRVYVKGQMVGAIAKALREAGERVEDGLSVGATLTIVYTGDGEAKNGLNPPKLFAAKYEPPPSPDACPPDLD
jgi:hypothetical protein